VGATPLAHFDNAGSNPSVKHSSARIATKPDEPIMLHHAVEVLLILIWVYWLPNSSAFRADQMEETRKEHLNVKIVHVNREQEIELHSFGCLWK
jgi:hypothetical protein